MSYMRAEDILPKELLELVQQYVDGQMIYIPRKSESHRSWGTGTETKKYLTNRSRKIYQEYLSGITVKELAERYFLAEKSVQRIIRNQTK